MIDKYKIKDIAGAEVVRFADVSVLRYEAVGFDDSMPLSRKLLIYHLSQATLWGRDIIFDQNGQYNLRIRKLLETVYEFYNDSKELEDYKEFEEYLFRFWFSNGIHHHYSGDKFIPKFSKDFIERQVKKLWQQGLLLSIDSKELDLLLDVIFSETKYLKRSQQSGDDDLLLLSSMNMYEHGVTEKEVQDFYSSVQKDSSDKDRPISWGLNSRMEKDGNGNLVEVKYQINGLYSEAISKICDELSSALAYVETDLQRQAILSLIDFYKTGDLYTYDKFSCLWVQDVDSYVDFINGFIETYTDPIAMRGAWEGLVHVKDKEATKRSKLICDNADWFERNSPIDDRFKKQNPKGVTASVVNVMMLGGDSYPATPIGINLPNADWIRKEYGSKSVSIENIHYAYDTAAKGSGINEAFIPDEYIRSIIDKYGHITDRLHTDMHECLGHGSGKLAEGVSSDALGSYSSVIEEARADLFALYYMADDKMIELGLLPDRDAYKACYYHYVLNGLITQLVRIELGKDIEEAHMRNRALISRWVLENAGTDIIELDDITLKIKDFSKLRNYFGILLKEIQRIKSEGDKNAAKHIVEKYAIKVDRKVHNKVLQRYSELNHTPYKGFVNPCYEIIMDTEGIKDVVVSYGEGYAEQMLRYSRNYSALPINPTKAQYLKSPLPLSDGLMKDAKTLRENLRKSMDGVVAKSMRDKGLHYGINFGLTRDYIGRLSKSINPNYNLAAYLISRDVRELKIIGQQTFPIEEVDYTTAKHLAIVTSSNNELRDLLAMDLLDRCPSAPLWAIDFLCEQDALEELEPISLIILARHISKGFVLDNIVWEELVMTKTISILDNTELPYITSSQKAALLLLKRWGLSSDRISDIILNEIDQLGWKHQDDLIKHEFVEDITFSLTN